MGYPFRLGMKSLLELIPVIKNFRSTGRFAWVFFYVITVFCVYFMSLIYEYNKKKKKYTLLLFIILPFTYILEGFIYHKQFSEIISIHPNLFDEEQLPEDYLQGLKTMDDDRYQAVIPLPFYHFGSETFEKYGTNKIYNLSMILSYHSQLPVLGNFSTRTSIPESKKIIQILSPGFYQKEIEKDIHSDKPFVIIYSHEPLNEYEQAILDRGEKLYSGTLFSVWSIQKSRLFENNTGEEIRTFKKIQSKLACRNGFLTTDSSSVIVFDSFENMPRNIVYSGKGSNKVEGGKNCILMTIEGNKFRADKEYILSFWMYNDGENFGQNAMVSLLLVEEADESDSFRKIASGNPQRSYIMNGNWSLIELPFKISNPAGKVRISLIDNSKKKRTFYIDDLFIKEKDATVYKILKEDNGNIIGLFKNNHRMKI